MNTKKGSGRVRMKLNRTWLRVALGTLLGMGSAVAHAARPAVPLLSIPMADLGYEPVSERLLLNGDSMFTLHFVDSTHVLVTFSTRGLLTRQPDADADDQPLNVDAVLLELPTGRVLARTTWHFRDHGQYLFPIAHGRFLLRVREKLVILAPLLHLAAGKPFAEEPFLEFKRKIGYVSVSPGGDMLMIETTRPARHRPVAVRKVGDADAPEVAAPAEPDQDEAMAEPAFVELHLIRLLKDHQPGKADLLVASSAGQVRARALVDVPLTSEGFLDISKESARTWLFDFQPHGVGKRLELAAYDSSCLPRVHFVSRSEFVAFGCRGTDDQQELAAFNFKGDEPWVNVLSGTTLFSSFVTAPEAGRFAMSRTVGTGTYIDRSMLMPDQLGPQEVTFFQTYDGRTLLKLQTTPFQRAGQNFDISPDGLEAAVIHDSNVEIYKLPPLTGKDEKEVAAAREMVPPPSLARVELRSKAEADETTATVQATRQQGGGAQTTAAGSMADLSPAETTPAAAPAERTNTVGDVPLERRTPPSLYSPDYPKPPQ